MYRPSWEWAAGFTEGEGCISFSKYSVTVQWSQSENNLPAIDALAMFLEDNGIKFGWYNTDARKYGARYPRISIMVTNAPDTLFLLAGLEPYLFLKRKKAQEGIKKLRATIERDYHNRYSKRRAGRNGSAQL